MSFGLDSAIEVFSGAVLLWRLRRNASAEANEQAERTALRLVGTSFIALAIYVAADSIHSLIRHKPPESSILGIAVTAVSMVVMPLLARSKRKIASLIRSGALHADSRQTDFCAYLSAITLTGLLLNALWGWWWADPIIGNEAREALRGKRCCDEP